MSSEYVYRGRILNLRLDQVRTPTGFETRREIVEHPGAVAIVPIDEQGRVVLVRQYRAALGAVTVEVLAGTLETGEDPLEGARRELREETGFVAGQLDRLSGIYPAPGWSTEYIHLYQAIGLTAGPSATEEDEAIDLLRVTLDEALNLVRDGSVNDAKSVIALLMIQDRKLPQSD